MKPWLYMVTGAGGNSTFRVTSEGVILVDGKLPGEANYNGLMDLIKGATDQPVKYLIVTHHHADHTGNNQRFLDAGVQIVAHENLNKNLVTYVQDPKPASANVTIRGRNTRSSSAKQLSNCIISDGRIPAATPLSTSPI